MNMKERMKGRLKAGLKIEVEDKNEDSFVANGEVFIKDNVAINANGVYVKDNPRNFTLVYEEIEIGEMIGRGSSSVVLHGIHRPSGIPVALKVINMFDKSKREQLIREICLLYDAECPSLISFYGAFYREGAITIALEYMDGGSLANVLTQVGPLPEKILACITFQVLWGLAYMKCEKRVHRDIKPSNLLINSQGEVKVTDFGVSAELQSTLAMCGTFVGTFKYMSPERIRNKPYSYASDIWSFGLVLMECATGIYPYTELTNCIEMAQTILECDVPELPSSQYTPELRDFIKQCLHRDADLRQPAENLLQAPWLLRFGATSYEGCVQVIKEWIFELTNPGYKGEEKGYNNGHDYYSRGDGNDESMDMDYKGGNDYKK